MARYQDIIAMSETELLHELKKTLVELHELRMSNKLRQLKETHKIRFAKRYVSQIKTALQELTKMSSPTKSTEHVVVADTSTDQSVEKAEKKIGAKKQPTGDTKKKVTKKSN